MFWPTLAEKDAANLLANRGPARLSGEEDPLPRLRSQCVESPGDSRLARTVEAFKGDEEARQAPTRTVTGNLDPSVRLAAPAAGS